MIELKELIAYEKGLEAGMHQSIFVAVIVLSAN